MACVRAVCLRMAAKPPRRTARRFVRHGFCDLRRLWLCLLVSLRSQLPRSLAWLARVNASRIRAASNQHPQRLALVAFLSGLFAACFAYLANGLRFGMAPTQSLSDSVTRRRRSVCQRSVAAELQHDNRMALPFDRIAGARTTVFTLSFSVTVEEVGN